MLQEYAIVTGLAVTPISDVRGAILYGLLAGLNPIAVFALSIIANIATIPIIFYLLTRADFLNFANKLMGTRVTSYIQTNKERLAKWEELALFTFVAIPLPFTGSWMGVLVATALQTNKKKAFLAISAGVIVAATITFLGIGGSLFALGRL